MTPSVKPDGFITQPSIVKPARSNVKRSGAARATSAFQSRFRSVIWRSRVPSDPHTKTSAGESGAVAEKAIIRPSALVVAPVTQRSPPVMRMAAPAPSARTR